MKENWKETGYAGASGSWINKKKRGNFTLVVEHIGGGKYEVFTQQYSPNSGTTNRVLKTFTSEEDALNYAENYMRTH
jgi:hypothetical protein